MRQRFGILRAELRYFADCVLEGRKPDRITPEESRAAVALMEAATRSRKPMQLLRSRKTGSKELAMLPIERVMVTGASGKLGAPLCETLVAEGYQVLAVNRRRPVNVAGWRRCGPT